MSKVNSQRGFTLLESLVALVLFTTVGSALYSWINTNYLSINRVRDINTRDVIIQNALGVIENVNPMLRPFGSEALGDMQVSWTSSVVKNPRPGTGYPAGLSLYKVGLYDTTITVNTTTTPDVSFTVRTVGYQKYRDTGGLQ